MLNKITKFLFRSSWKQKKLLIKENLLTDQEENITRLVHLVKKVEGQPADGLIIDVGAFDGSTSKRFSREFPQCKVWAFEPNPESFAIARSASSENPEITLFNLALSEKKGRTTFYVTENLVSSSTLKPVGDTEQFRKQLSVKNEIQVETDQLDNLTKGQRVLFIKIDTQGHELDVLQGANETLRRTSFVMLEMSNHSLYQNGCKYYEVDEYMRRSGFTLVDIIVTTRRDGIFMREFDAIYMNQQLESHAN